MGITRITCQMSDAPMSVVASFRVRQKGGDLTFLAALLDLPAVAQWARGDARSTPRGKPLPGVRKDSYISLRIADRNRAWLSDAINDCIDVLEPHREILEELRSKGANLELFVGWFLDRSGGDSLAPELMLRLARLGVSLSLDVYPSECHTDDAASTTSPA